MLHLQLAPAWLQELGGGEREEGEGEGGGGGGRGEGEGEGGGLKGWAKAACINSHLHLRYRLSCQHALINDTRTSQQQNVTGHKVVIFGAAL